MYACTIYSNRLQLSMACGDTESVNVSNLTSIPLEEIKAAQERLRGYVVRTPLVKLNCDDTSDGRQIYLKLENLQNTGAFKQRGAANALLNLPSEQLADGVYCPSAGNFAQGLAFMAKRLNVPSTIIVPETAPETKIEAIKRHGGEVVKVSYDDWWQVMQTQKFDGVTGQFVHPVCNRNVIAGNGTIGLEILEDLPDVDVIITPFGGGGMAMGIASAVKALRPEVRNVACEVATAAPLTHSRAVGKPSTVPNHRPSFVDGMGGKSVFPEMWCLAENLVDDTEVLSLGEIADAVRLLLERNRVLAEGAGAAPVAAALRMDVGHFDKGAKIVAVISGGNIDMAKIVQILQGHVPS